MKIAGFIFVGVCIFAAACGGGEAASATDLTNIENRLDALEAKLGMLPDPTASIMPLAERLTTLEQKVDSLSAPEPTKIPHLIYWEGSTNEMDLGPYLDYNHYYNEDADSYVDLYPRDNDKAFITPDCTGNPVIISGSVNTYYYILNKKIVHRSSAVSTNIVTGSTFNTDGTCVEQYLTYFFSYEETGVDALNIDTDHLSVALR